jgi:hypothetical protein
MRTLSVALALLLQAACVAAQAPPPCQPHPIGAGSRPYTGKTDEGEWAYWWCPDPYAPRAGMLLRRAERALRHPNVEGLGLRETWDAYLDANVDLPLSHPSLAGLYAAAKAHMASTRPPDPVWEVQADGDARTRPAFRLLPDGRRGPQLETRAGVGLHCICHAARWRVVEGSQTYCAFVSGQRPPDIEITLCTPHAARAGEPTDTN